VARRPIFTASIFQVILFGLNTLDSVLLPLNLHPRKLVPVFLFHILLP
jgi:hypothetical protein